MNQRRVLFVEFAQDQFLSEVLAACRTTIEAKHATIKLLPTSQPYWNLTETHRQAWNDRHAAQILLDDDQGVLDGRDLSLTLDRIFPSGISQSDRELYLSRLAELVEQEIENLMPECAVFQFVPHFPVHIFVARSLAAREVPVLALSATQLVNAIKVVRLPNTFDEKNFIPARVRLDHRVDGNVPSPRLQVAQSINQQSETTEGRLLLSALTDFARRTVAEIRHDAVPFNQFTAVQGWRRRKINELNGIRSAFTLRRNLDRVSCGLPEEKFVALFLQYTPEQNADPDSGPYRYPEYAVKSVRSLLNDCDLVSIPLIVREHPRQLLPKPIQNNLSARSPDIYERLSRLDGVAVCDRRISSDLLLRRAALSITAAGSSAWLAGAVGRPGLTLAGSWHEQCASSPSLLRLRQSGRTVADLLNLSEREVLHARDHFLQNDSELWPGLAKGVHLAANDASVKDRMAKWLPDVIDEEILRATPYPHLPELCTLPTESTE